MDDSDPVLNAHASHTIPLPADSNHSWKEVKREAMGRANRIVVGVDTGVRYTAGVCVLDPSKPAQRLNFTRSRNGIQVAARRHQSAVRDLKKERVSSSLDKNVWEVEQEMIGADSFDLGKLREYAKLRFGEYGSNLDAFYGSDQMKRLHWQKDNDVQREMDKTVHAILKMAGIPDNCHSNFTPENAPIICIGDGDFGSTHHNSLDGKFAKYLTQKARSLGFIVIKTRESYTSQKCCRCAGQLENLGKHLRIKFCQSCNVIFHRDVNAGENMAWLGMLRSVGMPRPAHLVYKKENSNSASKDVHKNDGPDVGMSQNSSSSSGSGSKSSNGKKRRATADSRASIGGKRGKKSDDSGMDTSISEKLSDTTDSNAASSRNTRLNIQLGEAASSFRNAMSMTGSTTSIPQTTTQSNDGSVSRL